ncbi:glucokinase [Candidatus Epulonipiscium fishelsonii]|uniref:Glucokinase n=1 Tax=Candidatus Epulonipiscium fishelsonii TaxID=77094 RepID=A0ACC8X7W8_9FIRM|nr:glucokinase [Epulopiscium sp. SCG-B11WGA-EpuloA1]ONI41131.1 glucokinase [Epulopiscium sp. SCG-B05WGA-EpuloA1]ONI46746.1 glucokinase [Epulopiscium sp. SCG-C06WGA-EpuloA1]
MYYIGVDLGGTTIKVGLINEEYKIVQTAVCDTKVERPTSEILKDMAFLCKEVMKKENISEKDVDSIGIGCPGLTVPKDGIILTSPNLPTFNNTNVKTEIQKYIDLPIYVENDANVAALGEVINGAAKGAKNAIVVTLGTGVGGGIIIDGKVYSGAFFGAGEVGHHTISLESEYMCGCGRKGCWEQYASATALIRDTKIAIENKDSKIKELANGGEINAKIIFEAAQAGDKIANEVLDQYFKFIGIGILNLINILQPEIVVLGGGMSAQKENLINPVIKYLNENLYGGVELKTKIKAATLGNDAGIIGAGLLGKSL